MTFPVKRKGRQWWAEADMKIVRGRWECVELRILPMKTASPEPITSTLLRSLDLPGQIQKYRDTQVDFMAAPVAELTEGEKRDRETTPATERGARTGRPPEYDLTEVARVYIEAHARRAHPTKAVHHHLRKVTGDLRVTRNAAAQAVRRARKQGLLSPTPPGVAGSVEPKTQRRTSGRKGKRTGKAPKATTRTSGSRRSRQRGTR